MGPYKPLRNWVDEFIPYYMEMSWEWIDPIAHMKNNEKYHPKVLEVKGGRWYIITQLAVYTAYILGIYWLLGGYIIPTAYHQNQNNPLILDDSWKV